MVRTRGAVEHHLEHQTLNQKNRGSNFFAAASKIGQFRSLYVAPVHSAV